MNTITSTDNQSSAPSAEQVGLPAQFVADEIAALYAVVQGTAHTTGEAFFKSLVEHMARAMGTEFAFVAEFVAPMRARTMGFWNRGHVADNVEWDVTGTPCEDVVGGNLCHYPTGVSQRFPRDEPMVAWGIESYLGVPLLDPEGQHLGHLAVFDTRPMPPEPQKMFILRVFAARATAELQRLRYDAMLSESERRFRDLYEEAPIAYIYEDLESRFVRANRAACRLLGIRPEDVPQTFGKSLLAPVPDTVRKIEEALAAMKAQGKEFAGVELELRRKDDGRPIWVQWWSKPEPDGLHTRTMLVDVTERVLMEREKARLEQQNLYLREELKQTHNFEEIIGRSGALVQVLENVRLVAPTDASVLITGESGTGKELIARAIHSTSSRRDMPLIKVNCAALPTGLVESELFGHERGAFSGAIARRVGRFELAHGGTLFLDEIGEVPPEVQVKLLRVLQEREFERVGGNTPIRCDVRIIAATNRNLHEASRGGAFREDLFYRLNVFPVHLPPLRERRDDIPLLVTFLVDRFATRIGKRIAGIDPETMQRLLAYRWPGNVRELENVIERAVILASSPVLRVPPELLSPHVPLDSVSAAVSPRAASASEPAPLHDVERSHILDALERARWVIDGDAGAAKMLGLHPNTLRSRLKKMGIRRPGIADASPPPRSPAR